MCTGRRREVNRRSMGGRRVTADRRYENGESGGHSQDISNLHSFLLSCSTLAFAQRISTHRESSSYPLEQARGTLLVNSGHVDCHVIDLPNPWDSALDRRDHRRCHRSD